MSGAPKALVGLGALVLFGMLAMGSQTKASLKPQPKPTPKPTPKPQPKPKPGPPPPGSGPLPSFDLGGHEWLRQLPNRENVAAREQAFCEAIDQGYFVPVVWCPVDVSVGIIKATIWVTSDAICLGRADDFVRICVSAITAQRIADKLGAYLNTTRTADLSYLQAAQQLVPCDMGPGSSAALEAMIAHSDCVQGRIEAAPGELVRDVGKDAVLSNRLVDSEGVYQGEVALCGWRWPLAPNKTPSGIPAWQPLATPHPDGFVDDSGTVTVVQEWMDVGGQQMLFEDVAADPDLHVLVSDEGPLRIMRYPTVI